MRRSFSFHRPGSRCQTALGSRNRSSHPIESSSNPEMRILTVRSGQNNQGLPVSETIAVRTLKSAWPCLINLAERVLAKACLEFVPRVAFGVWANKNAGKPNKCRGYTTLVRRSESGRLFQKLLQRWGGWESALQLAALHFRFFLFIWHARGTSHRNQTLRRAIM
jgi:hypothetical protein